MLSVVLTATIFIGTVFAQTGIYFGIENGPRWDKFNYINSRGFYANKLTTNYILGGFVGFKLNHYSIETGLYYHYFSENDYTYNRSTGELNKYKGGSHSSGDNKLIIPLRFGVEFKLLKNTIFIKPEIGVSAIITKEYNKTQPYGAFFESPNLDSLSVPINGDSTMGLIYQFSKFNLGYEVSLTAGFRIKKRFDIYFKGSLFNSFTPMQYETITYYSNSGNETATKLFHGNSFALQIGLRYQFDLKKKK